MPGVPAAIVAVPVTVSILVLCVVVAIAMMLRGPGKPGFKGDMLA